MLVQQQLCQFSSYASLAAMLVQQLCQYSSYASSAAIFHDVFLIKLNKWFSCHAASIWRPAVKLEPFLTTMSVKSHFWSHLDVPIQFCQMPGKEFNIKSTNTSCLEASFRFNRLIMKGKLSIYQTLFFSNSIFQFTLVHQNFFKKSSTLLMYLGLLV